MPERGGSLRCQRTHLIAPLTNTAVLSEQDGVGLHKGKQMKKRRQQPLANGARNAELLPDCNCGVDNPCPPCKVVPLFWRSVARTSPLLDCLGVSNCDPKECSHQMCVPWLVQFVSLVQSFLQRKTTMNALVHRMRVGYDINFKTATGLGIVL